jgi:hypothetical protein
VANASRVVQVVRVGGAIASRIQSPNSETQTLALFAEHLRAVRP